MYKINNSGQIHEVSICLVHFCLYSIDMQYKMDLYISVMQSHFPFVIIKYSVVMVRGVWLTSNKKTYLVLSWQSILEEKISLFIHSISFLLFWRNLLLNSFSFNGFKNHSSFFLDATAVNWITKKTCFFCVEYTNNCKICFHIDLSFLYYLWLD